MARQTLNDGSDGTVVISPGRTSSSGGFRVGSGGFSGGFGGSGGRGGRRAKARRKAREQARQRELQARLKAEAEKAEAAARAAELGRLKARQQAMSAMVQRYDTIRAEVDRNFASRAQQLDTSLQQEVTAAKRPPASQSSERWQLYLITKEKNEIDGLIARKVAELNARDTVARSFDGRDPLTGSVHDYQTRLDQFGAALEDGHKVWEQAYTAAQEAKLLSAQIKTLTDKSNALARRHAEQSVAWREREAVWERHRQYAEQRAARIRFKQQVDEAVRRERLRQTHTLRVPASSMAAASGMVLTRDTVFVAQHAAAILEQAVAASIDALKDSARVLLRTGPVFVTAMVYSPALGNGELSAEQRRRLFQGVGVPAQAFGLSDGQALQSVADAGGSVEVAYRLKPQAVSEGAAIHVASTGDKISASVPVINGVLDPLTGLYNVEVPGFPTRYLQLSPDSPVQVVPASLPGLIPVAPQVQILPTDVDLRIQDCIVCVPGLPPTYFSFDLPPLGTGVVTGAGKAPADDWWSTASQTQGAAIPEQVGHLLQAREVKSFAAFEQIIWQALAERPELNGHVDVLNKKRIEQGFAPYAPKSTWAGERREFELRYQDRVELGGNPFDLDRISITTPQSLHGLPGLVPAVLLWPTAPIDTSTRTPLVPPGIELLGPTASPTAPAISQDYPGNPVIPVLPQNETFPAVEPGQVGASIPGYPADMELPSLGLVFVGPPVEPLEVGPYNELSGRSRGDGLDIDHIPSRKALRAYIDMNHEDMSTSKVREAIRRAPCIAIPSSIHQKFSETYGGRNSFEKSMSDASDLEAAVNGNLAALKPGLIESGASESDIDAALKSLHELHKKQGWY
ncbi:hypothetical protein LOY35_16960 [Pseudomonas sp. B21-028]|jgi:hypothetical protein|uniref:S-type pyocin domain-containing protein n=1 Tax=Pseudomonas sp. B21-028 TaxID=2895480 RepID=UPI00215FC9E0|nr:S-type pyocin domain-containing protein [Pseudomonas sp. B21-028]UVL81919.1 hypothetical protein LOY35_16960 [Pseudomonas sp. B21-028]